MSYLDIIIIVPLLWGLVRGLMRGVVKEVTVIVAVIAGLIVARLFAADVAEWMQNIFSWDKSVLQVVAYGVLFVGVTLLLNILSVLLSKFLQAISLGWLNRLAGGLFGCLKWALIMSVVLNGLLMLDARFHFLKKEVVEKSVLIDPVSKVAQVAWQEASDL